MLDEVVQKYRDTKAARRLLTRLSRKQGCSPKRIVTDKLGSYAAAKREVMPMVEHRRHKGLNNRAENSHVPIRKRERMMQGFRSWSGLQRFVQPFPPSEITSYRLALTARQGRLAFIAQGRCRSGKPSQPLRHNYRPHRHCRVAWASSPFAIISLPSVSSSSRHMPPSASDRMS